MPNVTMKEMLESGAHFGHQTNHWNPRMRPYVFGARNGIYIIDLQQTVEKTKEACEFVKKIAGEGKKVLFVGTKKQAKDIIETEASRAEMPHVTQRWLGGMLTNYQTVRASIDRMKKIEELKETDDWNDLVKKEQSRKDKELEKLKKSLGGIRDMKKLPGAIFVVDTIKEYIAIKEARKLGIPTVALVDTNGDPTLVDHVIPGNDDAIRSVSLFARLIADSCVEGQKAFQDRVQEKGEGASEEKEEKVQVSKFEGDVDLKGLDEADLEAMEKKEEEPVDTDVKIEGVTVIKAEDQTEESEKKE